MQRLQNWLLHHHPFEANSERYAEARVLAVLLPVLLVLAPFSGLLLVAAPEAIAGWRQVVRIVSEMVVYAVGLVLLRRGQIRVVSVAVVTLIWLEIAVVVLLIGSVNTPVVMAFFVPLFLAGLLMGSPCAGLAALATTLFTSVLFFAEVLQPGVTQSQFQPALFAWVSVGFVSLMLVVFQRLSSTTLRELRAEANQNADQYRQLFNSSLQGILIADPAGQRVLMANTTAERTLGYTADGLRGQLITALVQPVVEQGAAISLPALVDSVVEWHEHRLVRPHAPPMPVLVNVQRLPDGNLRYVFRDITERRKYEERYRLISSVIGDYVFLSEFDASGALVHTWLDGNFETITGYTPEEFLAIGGWRATILPDDYADDDRAMAELQANRSTISEVRVRRKDGTLRWVRVYGHPLWDGAASRLAGIYGAVQDITDRKRAELALQASEMRYRTIVDAFPDLILISTLDGQVLFANPAVEAQTGYTLDDFNRPGRPSFIHPDDLPRVNAEIAGLLKSEQTATELIENRFIDKWGRVRWYNGVITKVQYEGQVALQTITRDVTERREAEAQIHALNAELEQRVHERTAQLEKAREEAVNANRVKSQFLATMSHELRTPLNAILNFTQFVSNGLKGPVNDAQKDALGKVETSARHLLALINDILDVTRIETGSIELFWEDDVDIARLLDDVYGMGRALVGNKPVALRLDVAPNLPPVRCDPRRLRQIVLNLVANAVKFTPQGQVRLAASVEADMLCLTVTDTGPGIPAEYQESIFEPFRQLDRSGGSAVGVGLGLPISRYLTEAHGGRLWVVSQPGQGATFFMTLPVVKQPAVMPR